MSPAEKKTKAARQSIRRPSATSRQSRQAAQEKLAARQPIIVKTSETSMMGVRSFEASRFVLGYVVTGRKYIYNGDLRAEIRAGDIFFLNKGVHHIEEVPEGRKPFEQILFFYTNEQMARIVAALSVNYHTDTCVHHTCDECMIKEYVISPGWNTLKYFFAATGQQLRDGYFAQDPTAEMLALTSLVYNIISRPEGCMRTRVLGSTDPERELMERLIGEYVFAGIPLKEFAEKNNRSLTSFKNKFKKYYNEPPHQWVLRQRLMHARLLVISTKKPIAQIGRECHLPNNSHFIRAFGKEFGMSPTQYRRLYNTAEKTGTEIV